MKLRANMGQMNWNPRHLRGPSSRGSEGTGVSRNEKRSRLGTRAQRNLYCSAHGYKSKNYSSLCRRADKLNGG